MPYLLIMYSIFKCILTFCFAPRNVSISSKFLSGCLFLILEDFFFFTCLETLCVTGTRKEDGRVNKFPVSFQKPTRYSAYAFWQEIKHWLHLPAGAQNVFHSLDVS